MGAFLTALLVTFTAGLLAYWLAERKGRATRMWVLLSALFLLPLVLLALLPPKRPVG